MNTEINESVNNSFLDLLQNVNLETVGVVILGIMSIVATYKVGKAGYNKLKTTKYKRPLFMIPAVSTTAGVAVESLVQGDIGVGVGVAVASILTAIVWAFDANRSSYRNL